MHLINRTYSSDKIFSMKLANLRRKLGYKKIPTMKQCIDSVPINNLHRNDLATAMLKGKSSDFMKSSINEDTIFYKLSWREKYPIFTTSGEKTIYADFISN